MLLETYVLFQLIFLIDKIVNIKLIIRDKLVNFTLLFNKKLLFSFYNTKKFTN